MAVDNELRWNVEALRKRDVMAGKTASASLKHFTSAHMNSSHTRLDCLGMFGVDKNVGLLKSYRSAPNIDLLDHAEVGLASQPNESEDMLRGIMPVSIDKQQDRSIPKIVVSGSDENVSVMETCFQSQEPDIVQSTKSGSLPRRDMAQQPPQPVAPPRKKKFKTPSPLPADTADEVCL